ncbi:winged helix-turn-helix transcriptional regulator [Candidatus Giovannonibacteria bacterium]|nr:winged helix-turn-helix transcriptional regulator [Candidatus Giovannonibacteria bacterium]
MKLERLLKALANKRRLEILKALQKEEELSVGEIAETISLSLKATSRHLAILTHADILEKEQRGLQVFYRLAPLQEKTTKSVLLLL